MTWAWVSIAAVVMAAAGGLFWFGRRSGRKDLEAAILQDSVEQLVKADEKKAKQVSAHEKRSEDILAGDHSPDDVGRMLSTWPAAKDGGNGAP